MNITPNGKMYRDFIKVKNAILNPNNQPNHHDAIREMFILFKDKWSSSGLRLYNLYRATLRYHWKTHILEDLFNEDETFDK
jgi:hypothetical protein